MTVTINNFKVISYQPVGVFLQFIYLVRMVMMVLMRMMAVAQVQIILTNQMDSKNSRWS